MEGLLMLIFESYWLRTATNSLTSPQNIGQNLTGGVIELMTVLISKIQNGTHSVRDTALRLAGGP